MTRLGEVYSILAVDGAFRRFAHYLRIKAPEQRKRGFALLIGDFGIRLMHQTSPLVAERRRA